MESATALRIVPPSDGVDLVRARDGADPAARAGWRSLLPLVLAATDPARRLNGAATDAAWLLRATASYLHVRGLRHTAEVFTRDAAALERPRGPAARGTIAAPVEHEPGLARLQRLGPELMSVTLRPPREGGSRAARKEHHGKNSC